MDLHGCGVPFGGPLSWKKQLLNEVVLCFLDPLAETDVLDPLGKKQLLDEVVNALNLVTLQFSGNLGYVQWI
jgi:hypothetical protein